MARWLAAIAAGALVSGMAHSAWAQYDVLAEPCEDGPLVCARAPISFAALEALPVEFNFDTGWVPSGSPLQVRLAALLAAHTRMALNGALVTEWPHEQEPGALRLTAPGDPMGGLLGYHYGLVTSAEAKLGLSVGPVNVNWQGPIPYLPQIDFQAKAELIFDAWGWEPGVVASSSTLPETLATVDLSGVIGPSIPGLSGGFQLDASLDLDVAWTNHRIVLDDVLEGGTTEIVAGGDIVMAGGESFTKAFAGPFAEIDVHPEGTVDYSGVLHLIPSIYVSLLGQTWSIPIVDIPIPFDLTSLDLAFPDKRVHVPLPDLMPPVEELDFGEVLVGEESFRSYSLENAGELMVATAMASSDGETFRLWETAIDVDPGDQAWGTVVFAPKELGELSAELVVVSNDPDVPSHVIQLHGVGVPNGLRLPAPPAEAPGEVEVDSGCGCRTAGGEPSRGSYGWLALVGLALLRRRRE